MADGKLKTYRGKLLISAAAKLATADNCCCEPCVCPEDAPDCLIISGHVESVSYAEGGCDSSFDFSFQLDLTEVPCEYSGTELREDCFGFNPVALGLFSELCEWRLSFAAADPYSTRTFADGPLGAYPDVVVDTGFSIITYSMLVISACP